MEDSTDVGARTGGEREATPESGSQRDRAARVGRPLPAWLSFVWHERRRGVVALAAVAGGFGWLAGWLTPRGPVTTTQALTVLLAAVAVGAACGFAMRSRWAMLLAPVVFVVVFEVARIGVEGPTVDAPQLTTVLGTVVAAAGRGFQGVLILVPMVLGAAIGAGVARRVSGQPAAGPGRRGAAGLIVRRGFAVVVTASLLLIAVLVARPGSTTPILGPDGEPLPGGVAEIIRVPVGAHDLSMMIRGRDVTDPVLLYLAGGPGGAEFGAMRRHGQALEQDFVVVTLDQRGTGSSYDQIEPTSTLTVQEAVDDVAGVTEYLRARFHQQKIYLVGQSWGTILGVLAAQSHPELYQAFVGVGQMVSPRETDLVFYQDTLSWAERSGNSAVFAQVQAMGPPPWSDVLNYSTVLGYEQDVYPYDHSRNAEGAGQMTENLPIGEYGLLDTVNIARGLADCFALLYPQLQNVDFRVDVPQLDVPVFLAEGRHEPRGRLQLAEQWFAQLQAPSKQWTEFPASGHRPIFEQPEEFHQLMTRDVLAAAEG